MTLDCSHWQISSAGSRAIVEGCDLVALAREYGTPLFVVNESRLRENCRSIKRVFDELYEEPAVFFSYKTNPVPEVLRIIHEEGLGAELISEFELYLADYLGIGSDRIVYDAIYKTDAVLEKFVQRGVKVVNIDSVAEIDVLERLAQKYGRTIAVGVRLNTSSGWGKNPFGIHVDDVLEAFERIAGKRSLLPAGLHIHTSSWAASPESYLNKARLLVSLVKALDDKLKIQLKYINLGGGYGCSTVRKLGRFEQLFNARFGLDLKPPDVARFVPLAAAINVVHAEVEKLCSRHGLKAPLVCIEPGTAVVANTQFLLATVSAVKVLGGRHIVVTDAGQMTIAQPLRTEYHELIVANRMNEPGKKYYQVVGRLCSPGDWMYQKKLLPEIEPGDVLAIMDTGAYFIALSNNFSFPRPPVVSVCNGRARLLRRGEDFDHLTALDRA